MHFISLTKGMSGNINDTNIPKLKDELDLLLIDINTCIENNENPQDNEHILKKKYKNIANTSSTLFKFILDNYGKQQFNKEYFTNTIKLMFDQIIAIQNAKTSQQDASEKVGSHLATQFFPSNSSS